MEYESCNLNNYKQYNESSRTSTFKQENSSIKKESIKEHSKAKIKMPTSTRARQLNETELRGKSPKIGFRSKTVSPQCPSTSRDCKVRKATSFSRGPLFQEVPAFFELRTNVHRSIYARYLPKAP